MMIILHDFAIENELSKSGQMSRSSINYQEKKNPLVDFAVPPDHRKKIKESEKIDKYLYLTKKLKIN